MNPTFDYTAAMILATLPKPGECGKSEDHIAAEIQSDNGLHEELLLHKAAGWAEQTSYRCWRLTSYGEDALQDYEAAL